METGPRALVRAGDGTVGTPAAMAWTHSGDSQPSWGKGRTASRGTIRGTVVLNCLAPLSPAGLRLWQRARWNQRSRLQSREASVMRPRPGFKDSSAVSRADQVLRRPCQPRLQNHTLARWQLCCDEGK